jgi:M6 family metalloprotease-like protein
VKTRSSCFRSSLHASILRYCLSSAPFRVVVFTLTLAAILLAAAVALNGLPLAQASGAAPATIELELLDKVEGWLSIVWPDGKPGTAAAAPLALIVNDEQRVTHVTPGPGQTSMTDLLSLDRTRVTAYGSWAAPDSTTEYPLFVAVAIVHDPGADLSAALPKMVSGSQPWLTIMCKFSDYTAEPRNRAYFVGMLDSTFPHLDDYWRQASYDVANIAGSNAYGWFTLPQPRSNYVTSGGLDHRKAAQDCTNSAASMVTFSNYVGINLMFNADLDGYAWGGTMYMTIQGQTRMWYMTWEPPWGYADIGVIAHEMGHGFGLPHSSGNYGQVYDNVWDVMSDVWAYCSLLRDPTYGCVGQGTIGYHKDRLGWITTNRKATITTGATRTLTIERLANSPITGYQVAVIPVGGSSSRFYTVEARKKAGYDIRLPAEGVIIHEVDTTRSSAAHVVDVDGNGETGDAGAVWIPGEVFNDAANGVWVRVESASADGYVVTIGNGTAFATPTPTATSTPTPAPVPVFTASLFEGSYPLTIQFTNESQNAFSSYQWQFGDGVSSTLASPVHTYWMTGSFTVTLSGAWSGGTSVTTKPGYISIPSFRGYTFDDVTTTHPKWRYVESIYAKGVTAGCGVDPPRFCPDGQISRDQIAVFISRAMGWPPANPPLGIMADMAIGYWATPFAETLYGRGVTAGCGTNPLRYCPGNLLTRAEIATMIVRANGWVPVNEPQHLFADLAGHWAEPFAEAFYAHSPGTECGNDPGTGKLLFCPGALVSRADMAEMLVRAFGS